MTVHKDGTIQYIPDADGNTIPDFSRVGYHQGDKAIPQVPVQKTISPVAKGSSQEIIQKAIDEVAARKPDKNGFRGTILLKKGAYLIPGTIEIKKSGIVLRGEGDGSNGTRLVAAGKGQRTLINIAGTGSIREVQGTRRKIADSKVPAGATSFQLQSVAGLKAGDNIILYRPGTQNWISDLKMDQIVAREGTKQWQPEEYNLQFERVITRIEGNRIFIDNPVVMPMEEKYRGGEVYKYTFEGRITEVGVENILFESEYASDTDEDHGWNAISINKVENCWVRNVTSRYFGYSCVNAGKDAKQITVTDSKCLDAKSVITGGRRYSFNNDGQLNLFMNLTATEGRHDYVTGARVNGPNVFYNCTATRTHADIGPHHRWASGTLYDNIVTDGDINIQDRGNWGSGHGWSGVTQVLWNCTARKAAVQNPWVSGKNYAIGLQGEKYEGRLPGKPDGEWEGLNDKNIQPKSLYLAQLQARQKKLN
ncbi:hypothetical protein [Botryobacter ruber]|uniref:hypothetical protein n=1 Tax=Botryobacter ruber TaxID=2171629 RepID=UPI00196B53C6|nr:hypothetical protein [Botryobacter ruber]